QSGTTSFTKKPSTPIFCPQYFAAESSLCLSMRTPSNIRTLGHVTDGASGRTGAGTSRPTIATKLYKKECCHLLEKQPITKFTPLSVLEAHTLSQQGS